MTGKEQPWSSSPYCCCRSCSPSPWCRCCAPWPRGCGWWTSRATGRSTACRLLDGCDVAGLIVWPGIEKLTVISGGKRIEESSELLGSPGMRALVEGMKSRYEDRYIFFDVPPVLAGADAISFAPLVDHILFVVQAEKSSMANVRKALGMLPKEKILGIVLNRQAYADAIKYYY